MKKIFGILVTGMFLLFSSSGTFAQETNRTKPQIIKSYPLVITYEKTTTLVFPYAIKSVDRGSQDVLAQRAKGTKNVLQVKAASHGFPETNLTVITSGGELYSFLVHYSDHPSVLNLKFNGRKKQKSSDIFFSSGKNAAEITTYAKMAYGRRKTGHGGHDKKYDMDLRLTGLYVHGDVMYYRLKMENQSAINYTIGQLRFFIRDKRKVKRTASQETEVRPLLLYNNTNIIKGGMKHTLVVAVPKFTIPDKKYFVVQLSEKNGGRNLALKVHNRKIMKAVYLK